MTRSELDILLLPEVRQAIEQNLGRDPLSVALDKSVPYAREVATQLKYLERARHKLPTLYEARCIIPGRAFEQSSSEESAAAKHIGGESLLELTCGLGIDALALSKRFKRVVTLERDEVLADVVRENMRRMGVGNVEVVTTSAEEYIASCNDHFDWIYADPDRRSAEGRRVVRLEECSPNIMELLPGLQSVSPRLAVKLSPLFDVEEALRIFGRCLVEAVSLGGECKELMVYADGREPALAAEALGRGRVEVVRSQVVKCNPPEEPRFEEYKYLIIPDVAVQKARLVATMLEGKADVWGDNSFALASEPPQGVVGRVEKINSIEPFDAKSLKRRLKGVGVDVIMRDFPMGADELRRRCSMKSGSECRIAVGRLGKKCYTFFLG